MSAVNDLSLPVPEVASAGPSQQPTNSTVVVDTHSSRFCGGKWIINEAQSGQGLRANGGLNMIIFDTNAVNMMPLDGPVADIVRKLRQSRHHRVAVPWIVLEEMSAHQAAMYPVRHQAVLNTLKNLRAVVPWDLQGSVEPLDLDRFVAHWRDGYSEIFEVIETSGDAARKALAREAMALPPAKRDNTRSEGARDVAVWFSILEFLEKNPAEHVCFVTANTKDFGDGTTYPHPMDADLGDLAARLTRLTNFEDVVAEFTKEVSGKDAEAAANNLLRSAPIQSRLAQTAGLLSSAIGFLGMGVTGAPVRWHSLAGLSGSRNPECEECKRP
ncbi:PIN domain-containing protein [Paenarthrobacter ureafaciens]